MNIRTKKWKKLMKIHCIFGTARSSLRWFKVPLKHKYRVILLIFLYKYFFIKYNMYKKINKKDLYLYIKKIIKGNKIYCFND